MQGSGSGPEEASGDHYQEDRHGAMGLSRRPAPTASESITALESMGIEYDGRSTRLTPEMVRGADLILCMTAQHRDAARRLVSDDPELAEKIQVLDLDGDIPDPIGQGQDRYDAVAERMKQVIPERIESIVTQK